MSAPSQSINQKLSDDFKTEIENRKSEFNEGEQRIIDSFFEMLTNKNLE